MTKTYDIDKILQSIAELRASQQQTDEQLKQTDRQIKKTDKLVGELTGGWGRFVEDLLAPSIVAEFKKRGFNVQRNAERLRARDNGQVLAEYDVVLYGTTQNSQQTVVVVSVKSRVKTQDVKDLIADLEGFHDIFTEYKDFALAGAIAGVGFPEQVQNLAEKMGLFVIHTSEDMARLLNKPDFHPKLWMNSKPRKKK